MMGKNEDGGGIDVGENGGVGRCLMLIRGDGG